VRHIAGADHDGEVLDMHQAHVAARGRQHGIRSVPGVVVDGHLAACCAGRGVSEAVLRDQRLPECLTRSRQSGTAVLATALTPTGLCGAPDGQGLPFIASQASLDTAREQLITLSVHSAKPRSDCQRSREAGWRGIVRHPSIYS
jgi:hypothetical protein